ncbi:unnamed protein product [Arctogadus glacialis]
MCPVMSWLLCLSLWVSVTAVQLGQGTFYDTIQQQPGTRPGRISIHMIAPWDRQWELACGPGPWVEHIWSSPDPVYSSITRPYGATVIPHRREASSQQWRPPAGPDVSGTAGEAGRGAGEPVRGHLGHGARLKVTAALPRDTLRCVSELPRIRGPLFPPNESLLPPRRRNRPTGNQVRFLKCGRE